MSWACRYRWSTGWLDSWAIRCWTGNGNIIRATRMGGANEIDCGLCVLRRWRNDDKSSLVRHANNRQVWRNLRDVFPHPYTESDANVWLRYAADEQRAPWVFAI